MLSLYTEEKWIGVSACMSKPLWIGLVIFFNCFHSLEGMANPTSRLALYFVGVDFQERTMAFENDFGDNLFQEQAFQYDLYGGLRLSRYWGLQGGYFAAKKKNRTIELGPGATVMGQGLNANNPSETHYTETKIKGPHIDLLTFSPLFPEYGIELIAGVGVAYSKLMLKDAIVALNDVPQTSPINRTYDIKKANARALIGAQTLLLASIGVRALVTWENTSVFNDLTPAEFPNDIRRVNVKNSWVYGIGVFAIA